MKLTQAIAVLLASTALQAQAANHREAPITALDHKADITDVYAFRSYGTMEEKVTLIMNVDPLLEPANGPNYHPFDSDIVYEIKIDNNHDAIEDIGFEFRFTVQQRLPDLFQVYAGVGADGAALPDGTPVVPPQITSYDDAGLGQLQTYTLTKITYQRRREVSREVLGEGLPAVPTNVGPRTMDYSALFAAAIHDLGNGVQSFAGTVDDPFWIDLGGAFDTLNTHKFPVMSDADDAAAVNFSADTVSGYAVKSLAIEVPVELLTSTGLLEPATAPEATIGVWATTSRPRITVRRSPMPAVSTSTFRQVQRMGNPLINELLVGTGSKDRFSMSPPRRDAQFAGFFLEPALPVVVTALTGGAVPLPPAPRVDLLPVVQYLPPIAAEGTRPGPVADLLRLNTGVAPTDPAEASRLGLLGGDPAGFPNGRRLFDDVVDVALRLVVGGVLHPDYADFGAPGISDRLGDGVNVNDAPYRTTFPYLADSPSGRDRRHVDPGEANCSPGNATPCL